MRDALEESGRVRSDHSHEVCATMCYMSETGATLPRVGVRELRQNLSVYLDRVKAGESLEVTEHGTPVARLIPNPPQPRSILEQMIADGRAIPAKRDLLEIEPLHLGPGRPLSEIIVEMRDEDDR
jgi:prevent-host-death family protein